VLVTTILGSSLLKSFCDWIGLKGEDPDNRSVEGHVNLQRGLMEEGSIYKAPEVDAAST
jgi:hypothetical protein